MNQAKQIVKEMYNDGLENHLRLIADELTIDEGRGRFSPCIEEAQTSETNSDEAALVVPESIDKKVYIGDREGLTVSPVPNQLEPTYASISNRSQTGPSVQPHHAVINLHHHDRTQKNEAVQHQRHGTTHRPTTPHTIHVINPFREI